METLRLSRAIELSQYQILRLSKALFHTELQPIHNPSYTRKLIDWIWLQVQVKVDKDKLGNATAFEWPCLHRDPMLRRDNLDFYAGGVCFIHKGQYLGHDIVRQIIKGIAQHQNKHFFENVLKVKQLLERMLEYSEQL